MKKFNLVLFSLFFLLIVAFIAQKPMKQFEFMASYKKSKKMPLESVIAGRAEERANQLRNVETGLVDERDWYKALAEIEALSGSKLRSRNGELEWEPQGPDQVGGRTRGFIFDKTKDGRVYCGGVSGGVFVSENLGHNWAPVKNMPDIFSVMSVGCMAQSKDGDIYIGTGEYWGNTPNGSFGSQFNGHGIYKKKVDEEEFVHLPGTINGRLTDPQPLQFRRVIDMACNPVDNDIIFAATDNGMQVSKDGGATWTKSSSVPQTPVAQVKFSHDGTVIYAAWNGRVYKSTNGGTSFIDLIGNKPDWVANGNQHVRIAVSSTNPNKVYACGITGSRGGDLKYVIRTEDGGVTWELIGRSDAALSPLCSTLGCQGFYDLCLAAHPKDDDKIYLGGSVKSYSWSRSTGWVQATNWTGPATLGFNLVHADKHEFAFHPTHPDTMVVCTDGGPYISYNSDAAFPSPTWIPIFTGLNITQFYDLYVNKYGEIVGGTQDNGTQFITLTGGNNNIALEISGGDGFDCAISAANNYQLAYTTVYNGSLSRTTDLTTARKPLAAGCVEEGGSFANVGFHTRIGLVEKVRVEPGLFDEVEKSFLFVFNQNGQYTISSNAHIPAQPSAFTNWEGAGVGTIYGIHATKDISTVYIYGANGVRKNTTLKDRDSFPVDFTTNNQPCLQRPNLAWTTMSGVQGPVGGLYVHPNDGNYVVATQIGFGGTNKVFLSTNGSSFSGKQGNLPVMPVYSCAIDPDDKEHVVVATEFGMWETFDISAASPTWREANKDVGRVPVFKLRVNHLHPNEECTILYAGTHGRGFWRAPFPKKDASICDYKKKVRSGLDYINNIKIKFDIFPNPTTDKINVSFESRVGANYSLAVYDMAGRSVKRQSYRTIPGDNIINTDLSGLQNGKYIVRLESGDNIVGGKIIIKE